MTGEAGANRTFRSIFGEKKIKQTHDQVLYLELEQSDSSASVTADSSAEVAMNEEEEDETMWNDDMVHVSGGDEEEEEGKKEDNNDFLGLQFARRKSMVEWADDDDEEDTWKEALQDRVNQLKLAFQHNDDSTSAQSKRQCEDETDRLRQTCRHKMRRTSSHACITGDNVVTSNRPNRLWSCQRKVAGETAATMLSQNRRIRSTSIDFVARNIQLVEHHRKRSESLSGSESRTEPPSQCVSRKNPLDHSRSTLSKSSSSFCDIKTVSSTCATPSLSSSAAVLHLSDTEAIRRFVLEDVKTMSMERLVSDARRLHFLEDFYQSRQGLHVMPSVATSNSMVQPSLASSSSSSTMSTS
ncbi:unnamed protein product [Peronospora belbahrii]|uniref:PH domain-containing protein n=1 Tax=Peronospora belbahrii TaxID=622444 RepID=A0AAU9L4W6_9STRA|nr:unnamed protein product [Peronospora belbahrii]